MSKARKLAQMAAYLLNRNGGPMKHVKLMKLMYLADREAMDRFWFPISDDEYYSMRMGPVLSMTLDLMSGNEGSEDQEEWGEWVSPLTKFYVDSQREFADADLEELAPEEIAVMRKVSAKFGSLSMEDIVKYTHTLQEWTDPGYGRLPIALRSIFEALGKPGAEIDDKLKRLGNAKPNSAAPLPFTEAEMAARIRDFHSEPPPYPNAYADAIDAILSAR
jgi:uncharacterized phage-associated protein